MEEIHAVYGFLRGNDECKKATEKVAFFIWQDRAYRPAICS